MGDYGYVSIMPVAGAKAVKKPHHFALFLHKNEVSKPNYYSVKLNNARPRKRVKVEITSSNHCGFFKLAYHRNVAHHLFVEASRQLGGWIKVDTAKREITGYNMDNHSASISPPLKNLKGYFVLKFNCPIHDYGMWHEQVMYAGKDTQAGVMIGARVAFANDEVMVKIGTSFISMEQARENLDKEIPSWDFNKVSEQSKEEWNKYLSRVEIDAKNKDERPLLYTSMYHAYLFPRRFDEYGRYYSAFDDTVHNGSSYNDYSLWDTYRAEHPFLLLTTPELVPGMITALLQMYKEGGWMPKWPNPSYTSIMIGTHADAVIADAVVKGIKGFDLKLAYEACRKDAFSPPDGDSVKQWHDRALWSGYEARAGLYWYKKLGYVPVDKTDESVSNTLEGAYDDYCVAQVAKAVGRMDDYDTLMMRSQNYHNVYNPATGFMAPRLSNGAWHRDVNAGFTEGRPSTYLFNVAQDIPGMIKMMGGNKEFVKKLDFMFKENEYVHTNEPGHNYTYLYNYAGAAWKTQQRVAHYRKTNYRNKPQGMNGDDDCGQMSSWYIFSALGFYPVTPGTDVYATGTPMYKHAALHVDPTNASKVFEVEAQHVSKRNIYVQSMTLNGVELKEPFIHHADIVNGGKLVYVMGSKPKK